jgi:hypothetical protein
MCVMHMREVFVSYEHPKGMAMMTTFGSDKRFYRY